MAWDVIAPILVSMSIFGIKWRNPASWMDDTRFTPLVPPWRSVPCGEIVTLVPDREGRSFLMPDAEPYPPGPYKIVGSEYVALVDAVYYDLRHVFVGGIELRWIDEAFVRSVRE